MTQRLGVAGVKQDLLDGARRLRHHAARAHRRPIATFANGGKLAKPYAILELVNSKGDLIYSRERDEPEAPQVVEPRSPSSMNQMMQQVVTEGTGKRAALDFTNVAGKTGTSSGYRGRLVRRLHRQVRRHGVWIGNDDYRPMAGGITGGTCRADLAHVHVGRAHRHEHPDHPRPAAASRCRSPSSSASPPSAPKARRMAGGAAHDVEPDVG